MVVNSVQVQKFLTGVDYPAERDELVDYAEANDADDAIIETLSLIPDDTYETPADVNEAIGDLDEDEDDEEDSEIDNDVVVGDHFDEDDIDADALLDEEED